MAPERPLSSDGVSRRALLASVTGLTVATSGCLRRVRSIVAREDLEQLSVTIATLVDDYDRNAILIARRLAENLEAVGVDVTVEALPPVELYRRVLINTDFDLYVGRHPADRDPDFLYETLHSVYANEPGWQNPFGVTNMSLDGHLEAQRTLEGADRREEIASVLEWIAREQPFSPLCVPDEVRLVRTDRFDGWGQNHPATRLGYLGLESLTEDEQLRAVITETRPTENLNPLSAEYRNRSTVVSLLYDSVLVYDGDDAVPWLAESIEREDSSVTVTLREDLHWHDGQMLTADDIAFTYRFLEDTSLDENGVPSPSPQYRGPATVFDSIDVEDDSRRTLRFETECSPDVIRRALTVPILPEHVWDDRTDEASFGGVASATGTTDAVVTDNVPAVGSGPFAFVDRTERERLVLERFSDHFTLRPEVSLPEPTAETVQVHVEPRSEGAIERVERGDADATISTLEAASIAEISESADVQLLEFPSWTFYHLGYNVRNTPFNNPYVRRTVTRLLDKAWIASEVFGDQASPVSTPVTGDWVPEHIEWDGTDPEVPFFGTDGDLDVGAAKDAFERIGFTYDEEGRLLARN
ncbi:ABC transporter substrate-binding protein [Natrialbaceae archaeon A-gly3]